MANHVRGDALTTISEFAYSTGLSIKTLRYYDEIGLLPAAEVDEFTGYRSYRATQLREAVMLRLLRASGMGIAQMKEALTHPAQLSVILDQRRQELAIQRALEDWALAQAPRWQELDVGQVKTRSRAEQAWAGVSRQIDLRHVEDLDTEERLPDVDGLEVELTRLVAALSAQGHLDGPIDPLTQTWLTFEQERGRPSIVKLISCVDLPRPLPAGFELDDVQVTSGVLPPREEAFITRTMTDADEANEEIENLLPGGSLPFEAPVALAVFVEERGGSSRSVRQRSIATDGEFTLEWSVTLPSR